MGAPVRLEDAAFGDARIETLGQIAGYNRYEALGRMAHLWRWCTDRATYVVSEAVVRGCLGPQGVEALLESDLGERVEGGIRVRGTVGRVEWLDVKRKAGQAGGEASAKQKASTRQAPVKQTPSTSQANANPLTLSPSLSLSPPPGGEGEVGAVAPLTLSAPVDVKAKKSRKVAVHPMPATWAPNATARAKAREMRLDPDREAEKFRHWTEAGGKQYASWDAAFLSHLDREVAPKPFGGGPRSPPTAFDAQAERVRMLREQERREAEGSES
jgi:hypothetical protein